MRLALLLVLVTAPTAEPVSVDEAKLHLRVEASLEDDLIRSKIAAARQTVELETGRQIAPARWDVKLNCFPRHDTEPILIPRPPLRSVVSITYVDTAGVTQTWAAANYQVAVPVGEAAEFGYVLPAYDKSYPETRDVAHAVTVRFDAGYDGTVQPAVPDAIKAAILLHVGVLYAHREDQVTGTTVSDLRAAGSLLSRFRMRRIPA